MRNRISTAQDKLKSLIDKSLQHSHKDNQYQVSITEGESQEEKQWAMEVLRPKLHYYLISLPSRKSKEAFKKLQEFHFSLLNDNSVDCEFYGNLRKTQQIAKSFTLRDINDQRRIFSSLY